MDTDADFQKPAKAELCFVRVCVCVAVFVLAVCKISHNHLIDFNKTFRICIQGGLQSKSILANAKMALACSIFQISIKT